MERCRRRIVCLFVFYSVVFGFVYGILESMQGDGSTDKIPESQLPMICFRDGSPPLPYASNSSAQGLVFSSLLNESVDSVRASSNMEQCHPLQKNLTMRFSNDFVFRSFQWHWSYNDTIKDDHPRTLILFWSTLMQNTCFLGPVLHPDGRFTLCSPLDGSNVSQNSQNATNNQTIQSVLSCKSLFPTSCLTGDQQKVYFVDIEGMAEQLSIKAMNISLSSAHSNNSGNHRDFDLWCFARQGAMPSATLNDYYGNVDKSPLLIQPPKTNPRLSVPFELYYSPVSGNLSSQSANFLLEPLFSNFSSDGQNETWTHFVLDLPRGAAGGNLHVRLTSDVDVPYELYARPGGLPSLDSWDYYYPNKTSNSNGSLFFKLYDSNTVKVKVDCYLLYAKEGTWGFGLRNRRGSVAEGQTTMFLSLERCAGKCSSHGNCRSAMDGCGLTKYRSTNIILVVAIGTLGLLVGWLLELSTKYHSVSSSIALCLNIIDRWQAIKDWLSNLVKAIIKRFRWGFVAAGFVALAMAGVSWRLDTGESYWIWHSVWHFAIYMPSFFFLCSKASMVDAENQRPPEGDYQLTRQDSFSRVE